MKKHIEKLVIIHTNDLHSYFENMPRLSGAVQALREKHRQAQTLVVDVGDHMDRMRLETEGSQGRCNLDIMKATGYELQVPGNNEGLTFQPQTLEQLYTKQANFTAICANMVELSSDQHPTWIKPYQILQKGHLKVGVIGVTAPFNIFYEKLGLHLNDPLETVHRYVHRLRPQVDVLVVMSHLGFTADKTMASHIKGIDCILGAHTHHLLKEGQLIGDTLVCAAGKLGEYVGEVELCFDRELMQLVARAARCYPVIDYPEDERIQQIIHAHQQTSENVLSEKVAMLADGLPTDHSADHPLGNLLADQLKSWTGAELGLVNSGQLLHGLPAGAVTKRRLLELCPSPIHPCRIVLQGQHIFQALQESLISDFRELPIMGFGFRGKQLGGLHVSGMEVVVSEQASGHPLLHEVRVNGQVLDMQRNYTVGTIAMFTFRLGYLSLSHGKSIQYFAPEILRDVLLEGLQNPQALAKCRQSRWIKSDS